jgi:exopolysaccharide biosynthesis polyprenyl glycosylphosphotransferase
MDQFVTTSPLLSTETAAGTRSKPRVTRWAHRYARRLVLSDALVVATAVFSAHLLWLGQSLKQVETHAASLLPLTYAQTSLLLGVIWIAALAIVDSRDEREIGAGAAEYRRVFAATAAVFAITITAAFFLGLDLSRGWALTVFPAGLGALLASRWLWRQWLMARRAAGEFSHRVVLIGSSATVIRTAQDLARQPGHGYHVVGAALTDGPNSGEIAGLPIVGEVDAVPELLGQYNADTVIATSSDHLPAERIRDLAWRLEPRNHQLVVVPSLTDVVGSRIHVRPAAGLPMIHVETPHYAGAAKFAKRAFDIAAAGGIILLVAPVLAAVAFLVARDSKGGVFYTQERVGRGGETFRILKFRTMVPDAEARLAELVDPAAGKGLFKLADDPRITRIGKVLRRYSLDELPQLFNILRGDMSLVGPRPALPSEVSEYDRRELRRLAVTPGLSGLWQVSGRSDLDWADGIRLDLYYVENWSMTQDLVILWRTAKAVLSSSGAY